MCFCQLCQIMLSNSIAVSKKKEKLRFMHVCQNKFQSIIRKNFSIRLLYYYYYFFFVIQALALIVWYYSVPNLIIKNKKNYTVFVSKLYLLLALIYKVVFCDGIHCLGLSSSQEGRRRRSVERRGGSLILVQEIILIATFPRATRPWSNLLNKCKKYF